MSAIKKLAWNQLMSLVSKILLGRFSNHGHLNVKLANMASQQKKKL